MPAYEAQLVFGCPQSKIRGIHRMQDRYAGDVGDYVKFALLRALSPGMKLGVAWYLYPDEGHNEDGRHTAYLSNRSHWRELDPILFDRLQTVVAKRRSVVALELCGALDAIFSREILVHRNLHPAYRSEARTAWFKRVEDDLGGCDLVFADPDNGLTDDRSSRRSGGKFGKQLPLQEALSLAAGRSAVIYHHNSRFKGGHDLEVDHWRSRLGGNCIAVRANAYSCRTFFIINPTPALYQRARRFCERWRHHKVRLHE
jgi:hypothetical protein